MMDIDSLPAVIGLTLAPNVGFFVPTMMYKVDLAGWYTPAKISEDDRTKIVAYIHQQERMPRLGKEINSLKRRIESMERLKQKSSEEIERENKLKSVIQAKNEEWANLMNVVHPGTSLSSAAKMSLSGMVPEVPLISWMMAMSNIGVGYASYVVLAAIDEDEDSFMPMLAYTSQLLLTWTIYPVLFKVSSFNFSIAHMGLSTAAALATASMFYSVDDTAGYMMLPQVLVMGYAALHLVSCGETEFKIRRVLTDLYKTQPWFHSKNAERVLEETG